MGDQRLIFGRHSLGHRQFGQRRQQRGAQRVDIVREGFRIGVHSPDGIIKSAACGA
jgi:hypothetical protein